MDSDESGYVCDIAGCVNAVDTNSMYCCEHDPVSSELKNTTCIMPGCMNTVDFNEKFLCMVCVQSRKHALRNENARFEDGNSVLKVPCKISGCNNNAAVNNMNMCDSCHQKFINNPFQEQLKYKSRNSSSEENTNENTHCPSKNQGDPFKLPEQNLSEVDVTINNNSQEVKKTTSNSNNSVDGVCGYGNVIPTKKIMKRRIVCMVPLCDLTVACNNTYCTEHDKRTPTTVCIMKGCTNAADFNEGFLCMICLQTQKRAFREIESTIKPVVSSHTDVELESPPTAIFSRLVPDNRTAPGRPVNAGFDFRSIVKDLPPIPMPTSLPTPSNIESINCKKQNNNTGMGQVMARGVLGREFAKDKLPHMPMPFSSLPPIPMPFNRSNSTPETTDPQVIQQFNVDAFTSLTPSLPSTRRPLPNCKAGGRGLCCNCSDCFAGLDISDSISTTSVNSTLPATEIDKTVSKLPCNKFFEGSDSSRPPKQICKAEDCKFFVNEGLGGYCSECFMCFNISDNIPPSPIRRFPYGVMDMEEEYANANRFENQLCKSGNCEFFGNDDFDGYCSACYKQESLKTDVDVAFIKDDDDKMCIICIQNVYNTVLLPCGHLYLCYECAIAIRNKGNKCPACRSNIKSFHRVYTPD